MGVVLTNEPGADSWPVTSASFILMHKMQANGETATEVLKFFNWAFAEGAGMAKELDYVPLPKAVTDQIAQAWKTEIKTEDGSAVWK
mgnify:FL=1